MTETDTELFLHYSEPLQLHGSGVFCWRTLEPRPAIDLDIVRASTREWRYFARHHYLTSTIHPGARCVIAFWRDRPVVFCSAIKVPIGHDWQYRFHRIVCLPDYQGAGIGIAVTECFAGALAATGLRVHNVISNPALIHHHSRSPYWTTIRPPEVTGGAANRRVWGNVRAAERPMRLTASFRWTGPTMPRSSARILLPQDIHG